MPLTQSRTMRRATALFLTLALLTLGMARPARAQSEVALSSLMALSDGHLQKLADTMHLVANTGAARSHEWTRIRPLLESLRPMNVACLLWFALPDGSYWTLDGGRQRNTLATRPYFPRVLAGRTVLGDLVISKATRRATAIVADPIRDRGAVVGVLGASVYLDRLSSQLRSEMQLPAATIFFSFDANATVALNWDKSLIFLEPRKLSPDLDRAFGAMLAHTQGRETYTFRGKPRTVIYRKSPVTGWWYALGSAAP